MSDVLELLEKTREMLATPEDWCKGTMSRARPGLSPEEAADHAGRQHCILGAMTHLTFDVLDYSPNKIATYMAVSKLIASEIGTPVISDWNDAAETEHGDVIGMLDVLIEKEKKKEGNG